VASKKPDREAEDRAEVEEILEERRFEEKLRALRKARFDSVKLWAQWITAVALLASMLKDGASWLISHIKGLL
jgi:hypothetical protein